MPIQHVFTKREQRIVSGQDREKLVQKAASFWNTRGYKVDFTGPFLFHAENFESHLGIRKVVDLSITDYGEASAVDLTVSATVGDTEVAVGAAGLLLIPLAAVVVGGVSWLDYDQSANREISEFWQMMLAGTSPPQTQKGERCENCGTPLDPDSVFCKKCGVKVQS
jgi:hypothetical protein